jgi:hypothetical protein
LTTRNSQSTNRQTGDTPTSGTTTGSTSGSSSQASQQAGQVADQVKQSASQVTDQAKQAATSQLALRKDQTAKGLNVVSSSVRQMGDNLRQNDQTSGYAQYVDQAADQIDRFSSYLQNHEPRQIMSEAEDWARRNPALVLGGAFALGLLASRFLKSGMGGQSQSSFGGRSAQYGRYGQYSGYQYSGRPYWNDPYSNQYGSQYGNQYGGQYGNQYGDQYSGQYGERYDDRSRRTDEGRVR